MDEASLLSKNEADEIRYIIQAIYQKNGPQIQIYIIPRLEDIPLEEFSIKTLEEWKIGDKEKGNGILLLISVEDRKMRIEVGQGIEGEITDIEASHIIDESIKPYFKNQQYAMGIKNFISVVAAKFEIKIDGLEEPSREVASRRGFGGNIIFFFSFIFLAIAQLFRNPFVKGIICAGLFGAASFFLIPGVGYILISIISGVGFLLGFSGILGAIGSSFGGPGSGWPTGGSGGSSGGSWSGGGGGFSGGGASGDW